ncbi:hypothetical protein QTP86_010147 [Hemibagrus guttatus]|nr:hypothetical protein QTP86_010147 [Hemibagrus guttatus]
MAPILRYPDPDLPFEVEVDASSSGLGAVLSQRHGEPGKLHPCAFYSRKLTVMEVNYDVGNQELLAIKAALEEWHHWLDGACHLFQVLTDHHNLEYLRGAKRLNPQQSRWAMFFTRFVFTVTYNPGSKNGKADALSRQFEAANEPGQPDLILLATAILAPVQWDLVEEIRRAHADEPPPAGCLPTKIFVPQQFRQQVMQWVHEAPSSGHPGIRLIDPAHPPPVLVALPGPGCGEVRPGMLHVRACADQSPTSGGAAGAPSGPPTPLVAPVGGLFD